ncbi:unnamed protein product [Protopolystoma xenopodis]|uniref:Uncharacterized protein n=1 Tax=Protopolystoma xenopodis TaxID=117903 RepID=A0A448WCQ7_9PLAT|nr:unnamed protein product [Protopolystoma xenopodis]
MSKFGLFIRSARPIAPAWPAVQPASPPDPGRQMIPSNLNRLSNAKVWPFNSCFRQSGVIRLWIRWNPTHLSALEQSFCPPVCL